ncbi:hypothetical protein HB364_09655 [Pseudoflavitalea sp. X16]|uniref:hypothetical protein n=1 Tax=Paraflavitalea devenefica TaxID=2716334 RepID=UPI00141FA4BF|nr:hypothetical protein [Paraflavitalea devenefica]NII25346.1 hypothetical protein [Paraflavitalea devenefica]
MNFVIVNDGYYNEILKRLSLFVPDFEINDDEPYLVLFEFSQYMIENIENEPVLLKCVSFISDAVLNGGYKTHEAIALQVFQVLYYRKSHVEICRKYLSKEALVLFEKYFIEYLKDYKQSNE